MEEDKDVTREAFRDGYRGKDHSPPNTGGDYTLTSPVGKGPGTSNELNEDNKAASEAHAEGQEAAEEDAKEDVGDDKDSDDGKSEDSESSEKDSNDD